MYKSLKKLNNYLWLIPFLGFLIGYQILSVFYSNKTILTPSLIGLPLNTAFKKLAEQNLTLKLINEKEDKDLPEGIILNQTPRPNQKIKTQQSIFIVISKKPEKNKAPNLLFKKNKEITSILNQTELRNKIFYLQSKSTEGSCIAQTPSPNTIVEDNKMITYISEGNNKPVLLPNFRNKKTKEVINFLKSFNIKYKIFNYDEPTNTIVIDQKPLPGTFINLAKPPIIQLQLKH